jgi:hypothetical protein
MLLQSPVQLVSGFFIYPKIVGRYLDIRLCSIPTVGVYEKQGKLHLIAPPLIYSILFISEARSLPPPPRWTAAQLREGL